MSIELPDDPAIREKILALIEQGKAVDATRRSLSDLAAGPVQYVFARIDDGRRQPGDAVAVENAFGDAAPGTILAPLESGVYAVEVRGARLVVCERDLAWR